MKTIHKFALHITDEQVVHLPFGSHYLHVGLDSNGDLCLWALVETDRELAPSTFYIIGTGHPCPFKPDQFVGTVVKGPFVWHVFFE